MIVKKQEEETCRDCGEKITLREYVGLEGAWYTDHRCPALEEEQVK
jgi:hypothetical protein